ncbi:MAG TPA: hypothetical protein VFJ72_08485 [Rubrobacteraceae bacterium]|nr:hypothetical protein [Rubrobacteraceae bacterium]
MSLIIIFIGALILVISLMGVAFGIYMSTHPKTREPGKLFAIWWVPGVAAAFGVFMRDSVTFAIGMICFLIAGAVLLLKSGTSGPSVKRKRGSTGRSGAKRTSSTRTTRENRTRGKGYRREAS